MELKTTGFLVGTITLWHLDFNQNQGEIGYDLHPDFQKRGLMSEAIDEVLKFGFHMLDLKTIIGVCSPKNIATVNLLEKMGFQSIAESELSELDQEAGLICFKKVIE